MKKCQKDAIKEQNLFKQGKLSFYNSYENLHDLHKIVKKRAKNIVKVITVFKV